MYTYQFDIHKNELIANCNLHPTQIHQGNSPWLYARNNKYAEESISYEKVGKWMLFLPKDSINAVWDRIKMAVASGELWHAKVSTTNPSKSSYAIMIYTKDHTDLNDVVRVLNYLESSGIKPPQVTIKYKTDQQTRAGIYSGGRQKPWIYSSDTVREATVTAVQRGNSLFWRDNQATNQPSCSEDNTHKKGSSFYHS
jgi:hypothetical protein